MAKLSTIPQRIFFLPLFDELAHRMRVLHARADLPELLPVEFIGDHVEPTREWLVARLREFPFLVNAYARPEDAVAATVRNRVEAERLAKQLSAMAMHREATPLARKQAASALLVFVQLVIVELERRCGL